MNATRAIFANKILLSVWNLRINITDRKYKNEIRTSMLRIIVTEMKNNWSKSTMTIPFYTDKWQCEVVWRKNIRYLIDVNCYNLLKLKKNYILSYEDVFYTTFSSTFDFTFKNKYLAVISLNNFFPVEICKKTYSFF